MASLALVVPLRRASWLEQIDLRIFKDRLELVTAPQCCPDRQSSLWYMVGGCHSGDCGMEQQSEGDLIPDLREDRLPFRKVEDIQFAS